MYIHKSFRLFVGLMDELKASGKEENCLYIEESIQITRGEYIRNNNELNIEEENIQTFSTITNIAMFPELTEFE